MGSTPASGAPSSVGSGSSGAPPAQDIESSGANKNAASRALENSMVMRISRPRGALHPGGRRGGYPRDTGGLWMAHAFALFLQVIEPGSLTSWQQGFLPLQLLRERGVGPLALFIHQPLDEQLAQLGANLAGVADEVMVRAHLVDGVLAVIRDDEPGGQRVGVGGVVAVVGPRHTLEGEVPQHDNLSVEEEVVGLERAADEEQRVVEALVDDVALHHQVSRDEQAALVLQDEVAVHRDTLRVEGLVLALGDGQALRHLLHFGGGCQLRLERGSLAGRAGLCVKRAFLQQLFEERHVHRLEVHPGADERNVRAEPPWEASAARLRVYWGLGRENGVRSAWHRPGLCDGFRRSGT